MRSVMFSVARAMAILGGFVLVALVVLTCVSVFGRMGNTVGHLPVVQAYLPSLGDLFKKLGPVPGDFELVEAGIAFAVLTFFPWCQLTQAHATVDLLIAVLPKAVNRFLTMCWEALLAVVVILIAWRMLVGAMDKARYGETTLLLQFPVWWAYTACTMAAIVACVVAVYAAYARMCEFTGDTDVLMRNGRAGH